MFMYTVHTVVPTCYNYVYIIMHVDIPLCELELSLKMNVHIHNNMCSTHVSHVYCADGRLLHSSNADGVTLFDPGTENTAVLIDAEKWVCWFFTAAVP